MMSENEREVKTQERPLDVMALDIKECACGWLEGELKRRFWGKEEVGEFPLGGTSGGVTLDAGSTS